MKTYNVVIPHTTFSSDINLATQTGVSGLLPGRIDVFNDEATAQDIVLTQKNGTNRTFKVPADSIRTFDRVSFKAIVASGTGTIAEATLYYSIYER